VSWMLFSFWRIYWNRFKIVCWHITNYLHEFSQHSHIINFIKFFWSQNIFLSSGISIIQDWEWRNAWYWVLRRINTVKGFSYSTHCLELRTNNIITTSKPHSMRRGCRYKQPYLFNIIITVIRGGCRQKQPHLFTVTWCVYICITNTRKT